MSVWFSMCQWPRIQAASQLPVAAPGGRLMTRWIRSIVSLPVPRSRLQSTTVQGLAGVG